MLFILILMMWVGPSTDNVDDRINMKFALQKYVIYKKFMVIEGKVHSGDKDYKNVNIVLTLKDRRYITRAGCKVGDVKLGNVGYVKIIAAIDRRPTRLEHTITGQ